MFMVWMIQYCKDICFIKVDIKIQCKCKQNPNKLLCETWQTHSKIREEKYMANALLPNKDEGVSVIV